MFPHTPCRGKAGWAQGPLFAFRSWGIVPLVLFWARPHSGTRGKRPLGRLFYHFMKLRNSAFQHGLLFVLHDQGKYSFTSPHLAQCLSEEGSLGLTLLYCSEIFNDGCKHSGFYKIKPLQSPMEFCFFATCLMEEDGLWFRDNLMAENFNRNWNDYENGFGNFVQKKWWILAG